MGNTFSFSNKDTNDHELPIYLRGVRLQVAKNVLNLLKGDHLMIAKQKLGRDPSPGEVIVHGFVKEVAIEKSFAEYLLESPHTASFVGRCNTFLSHTWGSPFEKTIAALEDYENQRPSGSAPCFYFIDYFAINQFNPSKDLKQLGEIAKNCATLTLFANTWDNPAAIGRAWCIFEIVHSLLGKKNLVIIMPPKVKREFKDAQQNVRDPDAAERFLRIFTNIDTKKLEASDPDDLKAIKKFIIDNLGGFNKVDQSVSAGLREWVGRAAFTNCESFEPHGTYDHADFLFSANHLFSKIGKYDFLLKCATKEAAIYEDLKLENRRDVAMNSVGFALKALNRQTEAELVYKTVIDSSIKKNGLFNKRTADRQYNLGTMYLSIQKWDEAEKILTIALNTFKKLQNPMSRDIRSTQSKLAEALRDGGKDLGQAELLFKEVLDYQLKYAGLQMPYVNSSLIHYARCIALKGEHKRALKDYMKALPILVKTYGEDDKEVKTLRVWITQAQQNIQEVKND